MKLSRRAFLMALGLGSAGLVGVRLGLPRWLAARPVRSIEELPDEARALVAAAFADVRADRVVDLHVHALGLGGESSGCWVNPRFRSHWHPVQRLVFELYLGAAGVRDDASADRAYVERLLALQRAANPAGRLLLLAFDAWVGEDGVEDRSASMFVVPDEHVCALARAHPELLACASVHPYRPDALERLERARAAGAVAVKWLPNAQNIDPAAQRCRPFYRRLAELGLPLLVHTGDERAVWNAAGAELGNPQRLEPALEEGATVVALHCASLGECADRTRGGARRSAFELFVELLARAPGPGRLFGEISAVTLLNRGAKPLEVLLERTDLHERLLDGSDYPLVALDPLTSLGQLERRGFLDPADRTPLRAVFEANPLLFDFVLKRRLRLVRPEGARAFRPEVFETARLFDKLSGR